MRKGCDGIAQDGVLGGVVVVEGDEVVQVGAIGMRRTTEQEAKRFQ